jgi:hypothetical protein
MSIFVHISGYEILSPPLDRAQMTTRTRSLTHQWKMAEEALEAEPRSLVMEAGQSPELDLARQEQMIEGYHG